MPLSFQRSSPAARRKARQQTIGLILLLLLGLTLLFWYLDQFGLEAAPGDTATQPPGAGPETHLAQTLEAGFPGVPAGGLPTRTVNPSANTTSTPAAATPASPTPSPAPTAAPTPTSTPQPVLVSQLLFLSEGRLGRWDPFSGSLSPVIEPASQAGAQQVIDYSVSDNGRWIALQTQMGLTADGPHDLSVFDSSTGRMMTLLEGTGRLYHIRISPDGAWIAYTTQENGGVVYTLNVEQPQQQNQLGRCTQAEELRCTSMPVWAGDSIELYWSDDRGVQRSAPLGPAEVILPNRIEVLDPRGQPIEVQVTYRDLLPSPLGRYLLAKASPLDSDVTWQALVDTRRVRVSEVPDTYHIDLPTAQAGWMLDGKLFEVVPDPVRDEILTTRIWRVLPTREDLMLVQLELEFNVEGLLPGMQADWIEQVDPRDISFGMHSEETEAGALLMRLDLRYRSLAKINELPFAPQQIYWSPDNRGALISSQDGQTWFAPADGSQPYNLDEQLGRNAGTFTWLPPVGIQP